MQGHKQGITKMVSFERIAEKIYKLYEVLTLHLRNTCSVLANSVDPDQLASEEANWSWSALFAIKYVNL